MRASVLALSLLTAASLAAQQKAPDAAAWAPPAGWTVRTDAKDSSESAADTKFVTMGAGFHVTSGPAAIYYNAANTVKGAYTVKASFGQRTRPAMGHSEAYGVFIGGSDLVDNAKQQYMYLVVRDDGKFYVAHRAGADVHKIVDWTASDAVKKAAENGSATNEVAIQVAADSLHMMVNNQRVKSFAKKDLHGFVTDGQYGLRVNHGLNVHIANFGMQQ